MWVPSPVISATAAVVTIAKRSRAMNCGIAGPFLDKTPVVDSGTKRSLQGLVRRTCGVGVVFYQLVHVSILIDWAAINAGWWVGLLPGTSTITEASFIMTIALPGRVIAIGDSLREAAASITHVTAISRDCTTATGAYAWDLVAVSAINGEGAEVKDTTVVAIGILAAIAWGIVEEVVVPSLAITINSTKLWSSGADIGSVWILQYMP